MLSYKKLADFLKSLDFDIIGFAKVGDYSAYLKRVKQRYDDNNLYPRTNMPYQDYVALDKLIEKPKTIISLGLSYHQASKKSNKEMIGYYSKSSWGVDYHKVIYEKLEQVATYLKQYEPNSDCFLACDTKSIDDRYFAYLCGNGFYGKNGMLINEEYGSEVFYGTIITNLEFTFEVNDLPESKCGGCKICEEACPTKSLSNYQLNYRSCLSHLSQSKQMISPTIINQQIYGCDVCNDCCPYNLKATVINSCFNDDGYVDLIKVIKATNSEYQELFKDKGLTWLSKNIIKKNAILCLGNYLPEQRAEIIALANEIKQRKSPLLDEAFAYILKTEE